MEKDTERDGKREREREGGDLRGRGRREREGEGAWGALAEEGGEPCSLPNIDHS